MTKSQSMFFAIICFILHSAAASAEIKKVSFARDSGGYLIFDVLGDQMIRFEIARTGAVPSPEPLRPTTPYIAADEHGGFKASYSGPTLDSFRSDAQTLETRGLRVTVDAKNLCFIIDSKTTNGRLTRVCSQPDGFVFERGQTRHVFGLGEQFLPQRFGSSNGDWVGQVRSPGRFGNEMVTYPPGAHGAVGNAQFPIMYAMGPKGLDYSIFLDHVQMQRWDFSQPQWRVQTPGGVIAGYLTAGESLADLRHAYMDLVGHPLVPPKKAFGLWVSQYGFDSWGEIQDKLTSLRKNHFPIDGFVMDLQWFGNVKQNSEDTRMGSLEFDTSPEHFPQPEEHIRSFSKDQGIGLILIEESYIGKALKEFGDLASQGFLSRKGLEEPATPADKLASAFYINENPWWGLGGMIDWTNPAAGSYWHLTKRKKLIDMGIFGHWTDLGEPEMYQHLETAGGQKVFSLPFYHDSLTEGDVQNIFSLKWHESIFKGYQDTGEVRRPFILSRSGGSGMQRYGAGMWSGDIGSKIGNLATHYGVQMQMSFSGQDYFGADIGGFHREDLDAGHDIGDLYTQWFADASVCDVPVRPHTNDLSKTQNTAPDRVGDLASNLANIRQRYELSPYYYSLAHLAYEKGDPVVPPLVYYYEGRTAEVPGVDAVNMGSEKLIGRDLLVGLVARYGQTTRNLYLPPGQWYDYRTGEVFSSRIHAYNLKPNGIFQPPLFVREGAIIPKMFVDDSTMNILGKRTDGVTHTELIARVYSSADPGDFTLYEDDGATIAYQKGAVTDGMATTRIAQKKVGDQVIVTVEPTRGSYSYEDPNSGATVESPPARSYQIELVVPKAVDPKQARVTLAGVPLTKLASEAAYRSAESGYLLKSRNLVLAKAKGAANDLKEFVFQVPAAQ